MPPTQRHLGTDGNRYQRAAGGTIERASWSPATALLRLASLTLRGRLGGTFTLHGSGSHFSSRNQSGATAQRVPPRRPRATEVPCVPRAIHSTGAGPFLHCHPPTPVPLPSLCSWSNPRTTKDPRDPLPLLGTLALPFSPLSPCCHSHSPRPLQIPPHTKLR